MPDIRTALAHADCEIRFDKLSRQLYSTDASIYQVEPLAVAFPRNAKQAAAAIWAAANANIPVIPRGAGSGLVGGAIGEGLVVEFARFNRQITNLDLERRSIRVGAGVVLDQLNAFLKPHGLCFGPDVATSSRATLGGMIANNSSGARTPVYGTTADHLLALEIVLADGRIEAVGLNGDNLRPQREIVERLTHQHALEIAARMPPGLLKRWPGFGLDRFVRQPNLTNIFSGSEGTLAAIASAELKLVPLPKEKGLALIFFASVAEAMQATVELLDLRPAALEHIDRVLTDQTKGKLGFKAARDLLEIDSNPCQSILIVEFYDDVKDRLAMLERRPIGLRKKIVKGLSEMNLVWALRKAGVALLTGCKGPAKPVTCIEDTAVRPERLPEYVAALQSIFRPFGVEACFYGHAASGLLHVRPVLDLHSAEDLRKFRQISNEVSAVVRQFKGSLAAEHGVGMARTEYMREQLGDELLSAMNEIKQAFDPKNIFNPGKIFDDGRYKIDTRLRTDADHEVKLPFEPILAFAAKDQSFIANLEQCNGCGGCRKETPTMCPTFVATGEEIMSTRGRANVIRAALGNRFDGDALRSAELESALSNCLSCKACTTECPSNVNLALLKAEVLYARFRRDGLPLRERIFSSVDLLGRLGCLAPKLANAILGTDSARRILSGTLGIASKRMLPRYAEERFDHWFDGRPAGKTAQRGRVILWDDCFVRYHEPHIGRAAVHVLEAAGYEVELLEGRKCCGRPAFSQGSLDEAKRLGTDNIQLLKTQSLSTAIRGSEGATPLIFLEPSCYSMFAEDYRELRITEAEEVAGPCLLFEQFIDDLLFREPHALRFNSHPEHIAIHAHCHAKALTDTKSMARLAQRLPDRTVAMLETGCCGMAGAFGHFESKYDLSLKVAEPLIQKIQQQPAGTKLVASGTSCRHQIEHLTPIHPQHMAEVLAAALL